MALDTPSRVPLRGEVDIERLVRAVPMGHTIKGAFVASNAAIVESDWASIEATLRAPPRGGKYVAFADYPLADYLRVSDAAARKRYPRVSTREAHRLLARSTFEVFARTALGRVTISMLSGPASALTKYQELYNRLVTGSTVQIVILEPKRVQAEFKSYFSTTEAIYGVLEGIVIACHGDPTVSLLTKGDGHFVASVSWDSPRVI